MSKKLKSLYTPLQSLNNIRYNYFHNKGGSEIEYFWFNRVEDALKALEIIKEKPDTLYLVKSCKSYKIYFDIAIDNALIEDVYEKEEFDLLKEVLL